MTLIKQLHRLKMPKQILKQNCNKKDKIAESSKPLNKDKIRLKMNKNKTIKLHLYHK
jgi:hypothetical protein